SAGVRRIGLLAGQLCAWRGLAREGRLVEAEDVTTFVPAIISQEPLSTGPAPCSGPAPTRPPPSAVAIAAAGRIEIVLPCGGRVVVDNGIDAAALARVLAVLERR